MIKIPDYRCATNAAYEILQKYDSCFPQIDIFGIIMSYPNVKVHTYSEAAGMIGLSVYDFAHNVASSEHGFTIYDKNSGHALVFFNDIKSEHTIRFTLAHELGHLVLRHKKDGSVEDREANCFARNLLCPVPLRDELGLKSLDDYCNAFDVSERMARVVIDRTPSDAYYITKSNYNNVNDLAYCYFTGCTLAELYGY